MNTRATRVVVLASLLLTFAIASSSCTSSGGDAPKTTGSAATSPGPKSASAPTADPATLPAPTVAGVIAFTRLVADGDYDVCTVSTDGTGLKTLASGEGCQMYPNWSPDASKIVFAQSAPGDVDPQVVWVMNADGSGKKQLTKGPNRNLHPTWSPDGKQIAYTGWTNMTDSGERAAVFVMNADGSDAHAVTSEQGRGVDYLPQWTKDNRIYFLRIEPGARAAQFRVNPDGSGLEEVAKVGTAGNDLFCYVLSPDGRQIAAQNIAGNTDRLVLVPLGSESPQVTLLNPVSSYMPGSITPDVSWAAGGQSLAVAALYDKGFTRIYVVNADGSGLSVIPGIEDARDPAWRPR